MRKIKTFLLSPFDPTSIMYWLWLAIFGIALFFVGCAIFSPGVNFDDVSYQRYKLPVNGATLYLDTRFSKEEVAHVTSVVDATIKIWEIDFNRKSVSLTYYVIKDTVLIYGNDRIVGLHIGGNVYCVADYNLGVSSLYHELCHGNKVAENGADPKHEDPRWPEWDRKCDKLGRLFGWRK